MHLLAHQILFCSSKATTQLVSFCIELLWYLSVVKVKKYILLGGHIYYTHGSFVQCNSEFIYLNENNDDLESGYLIQKGDNPLLINEIAN